MRIQNLTKCHKPKGFLTFTGNEESDTSSKKVRYKHFEQISDEMLSIYSIKKAHQDVQKSAKMQLFNAIPMIGATLIGTSIALTQPGRFASKAKVGLGFLATTAIASKTIETLSEMQKNSKEKQQRLSPYQNIAKTALNLFAFTGAALATFAIGKNLPQLTKRYATPIYNFFSNESKKLAKELNESKLGKFAENANLFFCKHKKIYKSLYTGVPVAIALATPVASNALAKNISKDIKDKASYNFAKGKYIQQVAREHFDTIDAKEV